MLTWEPNEVKPALRRAKDSLWRAFESDDPNYVAKQVEYCRRQLAAVEAFIYEAGDAAPEEDPTP